MFLYPKYVRKYDLELKFTRQVNKTKILIFGKRKSRDAKCIFSVMVKLDPDPH
jgi:hypothetical protein